MTESRVSSKYFTLPEAGRRCLQGWILTRSGPAAPLQHGCPENREEPPSNLLLDRNMYGCYSPPRGWWSVCSELLKPSNKGSLKNVQLWSYDLQPCEHICLHVCAREGLTWAAFPVKAEYEWNDGTNHKSQAHRNNDDHHGFCRHTAENTMATQRC